MREKPGRPLRTLALGMTVSALALAGCGEDADDEGAGGGAAAQADGALPLQANLLFTLRGDATATDGTLEIETDTVEWFTDRPKRRAGISGVDQLVENWKAYGFKADPPNAALGGADTDAVVELTDPEIVDGGVAFAFRSIRGELAEETEQLSVYLDSSTYTTSLHMTVKRDESYCPNGDDQLWNPQVSTEPYGWYQQPLDHVQLTTKSQQVFSAASTGTTRVRVDYDLVCAGDGSRIGDVTLSGVASTSVLLGPDVSGSCTVSPASLTRPLHECAVEVPLEKPHAQANAYLDALSAADQQNE